MDSPFVAIDPTTGRELSRHPLLDQAEVERRLTAAVTAQQAWARQPPAARAAGVAALGAALRRDAADHAGLITAEMGKPLAEARAEVEKCARACDHYATHGPSLLADEEVATEAGRSGVTCQPLGVVLAIMPWNFPYWQVIRFLAPALAAGNGGLLKHAPNVPGCALALERAVPEAGLPEGLFANLFVDLETTGELIEDPRIAAVTLTGSVAAGRAVAARAGAALKKTVLELGGSDAYVVLADADLDTAVDACIEGRLINAGQSCISAKRFVVVEAVREAFEAGLEARLRAVPWGDPRDPAHRMGPLARADLREQLHRQVEASVAAGARLRLGGEIPAGPGWYYPPTLLTGVDTGMPAGHEELFGPVAVVLPARDRDQALEIANATRFGLGAAVFTSDPEAGWRIAREELAAGSCFINTFVRSDPRLPFGGIRDSGYGRELGAAGIREFVNLKTLWMA